MFETLGQVVLSTALGCPLDREREGEQRETSDQRETKQTEAKRDEEEIETERESRFFLISVSKAMDNQNLEARREWAFDEYLYAMSLGFIGVSCAILQTVERPFETHHRKVVALSVTILIYFSLLWVRSVLQANGRNHVIVSKLCLLFGPLGVILPMFIIVPHIAGLAVTIYIGFFVFDGLKSYNQIRDEFLNAVEEIKMVMNTLRSGNTNEQVNGMQVENQHHCVIFVHAEPRAGLRNPLNMAGPDI